MTQIDTTTQGRLRWIAGELQKLYDNGWIRYEGDTVFRGAQAELADINATMTEPAPAAPQIVQTVMTAEQVQEVIASIPGAIPTSDIVTAVAAHIEQSDVSVLDAIAHTRADILAVITPVQQQAAA